MLLMILKVKKLLEHFMKKNYKRLINKNLGQKKQLGAKEINDMSNGKVMIIRLIVGLKNKDLVLFYWLQLYKNESIFSKTV